MGAFLYAYQKDSFTSFGSMVFIRNPATPYAFAKHKRCQLARHFRDDPVVTSSFRPHGGRDVFKDDKHRSEQYKRGDRNTSRAWARAWAATVG